MNPRVLVFVGLMMLSPALPWGQLDVSDELALARPIDVAAASDGVVAGKQADNPLTGTWDCQSKGGPDGDVEFKLYLQQADEEVNGSIRSPIGDAPLSFGKFKDGKLEIHIDTPEGVYVLTATVDGRRLWGDLRYGKDKGTWEGKKVWPAEN